MANGISRRNLLKGMGAGALGLGFGASIQTQPALAQITPSGAAVPAFYNFNVGELEVTIIKDAGVPFDPNLFGANVTEEEVSAAIEAAGVPRAEDGSVLNVFDIMVVRNGDRTILMDTGLGAPNSALNPALELLGIAQTDVTDVIFTHFHPDHVNGASFDGEIAYPNAQHYMSQIELDFIQAEEAAANALAKLQPIIDNDQLATYAADDEVVPNVMAVALPGHTMGHHGMLIESNGVQLIDIADTAFSPYISFPNPTWHVAFDMNPDMAVETRVSLMERAADEQLMIFGYHIPFPGIGYVSRDGDAFRFTPAAY